MVVTIIIYLIGSLLSYWMLRVDFESEGKDYTYGARLFNILFSFFSWVMVLITVFSAWFTKIKLTGYWARPVKQKDK